MRVWTVHIGETPPTESGGRPFRYTLLARALRARGHELVQWYPTFAHLTKTWRAGEDQLLEVEPGWQVRLVHAGGYRRHVGLARLLFYRRLARRIRELAPAHAAPDLILAGLPAPEVCEAVVDIAAASGARAVIDVQDLWPDIYLTLLPERLRPLARPLLAPLQRRNRRVFAGADAVSGVSQGYMEWGRGFAPGREGRIDRAFPLAVDPYRPEPAALAAAEAKLLGRGVDPSLFTACFLGLFTRTIDMETVLDALRLLEERGGPPVQLLLCGDGPMGEAFRARAQGLRHVHFLGWSDATTMAAVTGMASVGLAAYGRLAIQSIPNKPLEYLGSDLALLSSLPGEMARIVEETGCGFSYRPGDAAALAGLLARLRDEPALLAAVRARAAAAFEERFAARAVYQAMASWLEEVAGLPQPRPAPAAMAPAG
ncbi:glycosyltransferase [Geminicoccaceae bacterium 1502E]|nr:glycosyltransferase [Geminicoccaceae bacterium 1502E]